MTKPDIIIDLRKHPAPAWPGMPDVDVVYDCLICGEARDWAQWHHAGVAVCKRCRDAAIAARDTEQPPSIFTFYPTAEQPSPGVNMVAGDLSGIDYMPPGS
jgi:hypothetical protein